MMLSQLVQSGSDDYADDSDFEPVSPSAPSTTSAHVISSTTAAPVSSKTSSSISSSLTPSSAPSASPSSVKEQRPFPAAARLSSSTQRRLAALQSRTRPQRSSLPSTACNATLSFFSLLSVEEQKEKPTAPQAAAAADFDSSSASSLVLSRHPALQKLALESRWDPSPFVPQPPSLPHKQPLHAASAAEAEKETKRVVSAWEQTEQRRRLPPAPCVLLRPPRSEVQTRMSDVVMRTRQLRRRTRQHSSSGGAAAAAARQPPTVRHSRAGSEQMTATQSAQLEERGSVTPEKLTAVLLTGAEESVERNAGRTRTRAGSGAAAERRL